MMKRRTSPGNAFVVYEMRRHVFPTAPSPTTTHLIFCILRLTPPGRSEMRRQRTANRNVKGHEHDAIFCHPLPRSDAKTELTKWPIFRFFFLFLCLWACALSCLLLEMIFSFLFFSLEILTQYLNKKLAIVDGALP